MLALLLLLVASAVASILVRDEVGVDKLASREAQSDVEADDAVGPLQLHVSLLEELGDGLNKVPGGTVD